MYANVSTQRQEIAAGASFTFTDKLQNMPFKNLTVWARPADSTTTYSYTVYYGTQSQATGSVAAGKVQTFNDAGIQPPNQASSNWSKQDPTIPSADMFAVGLPISIKITNTGGLNAVFFVSFMSERFSELTG